MKKRWMFLMVCICICLYGCSDSSTVETEDETIIEEGVVQFSEGETEVEKIDINIATIKDTNAIGIAKLIDDSNNQLTSNNYKIKVEYKCDNIYQGFQKETYDIALVPSNLASVLYNKTNENVVVAAINSESNISVVGQKESIKSFNDMKGKTVYVTEKGLSEEMILDNILKHNNMNTSTDITLVYKESAMDIIDILKKDNEAVGVISQPYIAIAKKQGLKALISINDEWKKVYKNVDMIGGVVVARRKFVEENEPSFVSFLNEYANSVEYAGVEIKEVEKILEKNSAFEMKNIKDTIEYCDIMYFECDIMKEKIEKYLKALYKTNDMSIGGNIPENNFYYIKSVG